DDTDLDRSMRLSANCLFEVPVQIKAINAADP
ncbi:MAG: hypothetical protein ACI8UP_004578, partial [Porticoccaceae bacterium]